MALGRVHRGAQAAGPARNSARAVARRGKALAHVAAIGAHRSLHPGSHHPSQNLTGVRCELQLQQLLPHFFLRAAKIDNVAGKPLRAAEHPAAEIEQLVEGGLNVVAETEIVAEINKSVTAEEAFADQIVDARQPARFAMDRADRPDPSRITQMREFSA